MPRPTCGVVVAALLFAIDASAGYAADQQSVDWLRGSGKDLELRLRGEVFDADGKPATNLQVVGNMNASVADETLEPTIDDHRFELWIPINRPNWYSFWLRASSAASDRVAYEKFNEYQLRQAAIDGLKLTLQSPTRQVDVKVTEQGQPVAGATVKAELGFGIEVRSTTGDNGIARLELLPKQELSFLTAWTDDHRVGGFTFNRKPPRDPDADEHEIELSKCRDQRIRFVAENGSPVPGVSFALQIATPPPDYNYIGSEDHFQMTADAAGEAVCRWFPDWEKVHFYADINDNDWFVEGEPKMVDGVAVITLKKRRPRKQITGHVVSTGTDTGPGGFDVHLRSFQGERENYSDSNSVFSDPDGTFSVSVLPDATYCAYVQDEKWVGKIIDVLPYESAADKVTPPELEIAEGQPVKVIVTSGPKKQPVADLTVSFFREHDYSWQENGETRRGTGGPQWWATTDELGKATTHTLPGEFRTSVYTPRWRTEKTTTVVANKPATLTLHREIDEKQTVTGRIVRDENADGSFEDVEIHVASLDGNYEDQQSLKCKSHGLFSFDTFAAEVGIFAYTSDGRAAGSIITKDLAWRIKLPLLPTGEYRGQLLGTGDQPLVRHPVYAYIRMEGKKSKDQQMAKVFDVKRIETKTDELGNFTLQGIPSQMKAMLMADAIDGSDDSIYIGEFYLEPNESRPHIVSHLAKPSAAEVKVPLAERYQKTLRDCALAGYRPMIIIADDSDGASRFVNQNYASYDENKEVYPFLQIIVTAGKTPLDPADAAFLQERNWPLPQAGHAFACTIDAEGTELGRQDIAIGENGAAEEVAKFIRQHAPAPQDAEQKWTAAFAEAERTNRRVLARVSQRYCGPCFRLTRWLDDQRTLLEKDYVMLKIDDVRDTNGKDVAERLVRGQHVGVPFFAIFDASGTLLIDSTGPLGNIGHPSGIEGQRQLRKMLLETRQNLTDAEVDRLVESTGD